MPTTGYVPGGITADPSSILGGLSFSVTVTIVPQNPADPPTSSQDTLVSLSYSVASGSLPLQNAPGSITVPAGQSSASATVGTTTVGNDTTVTITASAGGTSISTDELVKGPTSDPNNPGGGGSG